jgi:hypothetical protein
MKVIFIALSLSFFAAGAQASGLTTTGTLTQVNVAGIAAIRGTMTGNPDVWTKLTLISKIFLRLF